MTKMRRVKWIVAVGGAVVVVAAVLGVLYFRSGTSPAPLTLNSTATPAPAASLDPSQAAGTWTIASGSVAGYRVREQLAQLPAPSDAVGRTSSITGTITLEAEPSGPAVSAAAFSVDVATLKSDRAMRDNHIRTLGLQTNTYPTATYRATVPTMLPATVASGAVVKVSTTGELTLHGVTKTVTIPLQARLTGSEIDVVGSLTFPFEQFGMQPPSIGGFVSVVDSATLEFELRLKHA